MFDEDIHQAELIDGKAIAQTIRKEVAADVTKLREKYGKVLICCTNLTLVSNTHVNPAILLHFVIAC